MPLTFVVLGAVSAIAVPYVDHTFDTLATCLLICNILILIVGIYLGLTHKEEPYWITISSIMIGVASVLFYGYVKYQWIQNERSNQRVIYPQLY